MAQHFLDGTKISSPIEKMGRKRVTQRVGMDVLIDPRLQRSKLDHPPDRASAHPTAAGVQEQASPSGLGSPQNSLDGQPVGKRISTRFSQRNQPLFVAFSQNTHFSFLEVDLGNVKRDTLPNSEAAAIQKFDESPVAQRERFLLGLALPTRSGDPLWPRRERPVCQLVCLRHAQDLRQALGLFRRMNRPSWIAVISSAQSDPVEETAEGRELPPTGRRGVTSVQLSQIGPNVARTELIDVGLPTGGHSLTLREKVSKLTKVQSVGSNRTLR